MLTPDEPARLATLHNLTILDTLPEQGFDDITLLAAHICETPIALVSLVDTARHQHRAEDSVGRARSSGGGSAAAA